MSDTSETVDSPDQSMDLAAPSVGDADMAGHDDQFEGAEAKPTVLELRQIAGLTAGSIMELHVGSFQFRESNKDVGFSLVVSSPEDVVVVPGAAAAMVDEIPVAERTPLGSAILNVGSACFAVRPPRPERNHADIVARLEAARTPAKAIAVPDFDLGQQEAAGQTSSSRFGSLFARSDDGEEEPVLTTRDWEFLEGIRDSRDVMAERHRYLHPNPEELRSRLERLDPGLWDRTIEHPLFARFPVAYSTIPWEPRFDDPERIPTPLHRPIREMSCLPWVPITANLLFGPMAIVGSRSAALACARSAVLSLACLTAPTDIEFSIVTAQGLVDDWNWTSMLPNSLFPTGGNNYCVAVADGMNHFEGAGFDYDAVTNNEMGLIVLADSMEEIPDGCGTILEITANGQCHVTNHLGEQIVGTPIGVTADFAGSTATLIRHAVGDGQPDEIPDEEQTVTMPRPLAGRTSNPEPLAQNSEPVAATEQLDPNLEQLDPGVAVENAGEAAMTEPVTGAGDEAPFEMNAEVDGPNVHPVQDEPTDEFSG